MSRPSFRPRPIDHAKPLPIIKSSKDLRNEDDVVVSRSLPQIASGVDPLEEGEQHLQQILHASVYGSTATKRVDIPIPVFSKVQRVQYSQRKGGVFRRPPTYINFDKSDRDLEHATIDYDADYEDEEFLKTYNAQQSTKSKPLSLGVLEMAMDVLEKQQGTLEIEETKSTLPYQSVKNALTSVLASFPESCRRAIFSHWSKRREQHKPSFLRLYQRQPDPSDPNPSVAFRPRDKDAAAANGRRLNTYENFKRAQNLRADLGTLKQMFVNLIEREKVKAELLAIACVRARLQLITQGGPRIELIARRFIASSKHAVILPPGAPPTHTALAADDIKLPLNSLQIVPLPEDALQASLAAIAAEKVPKKVVRRSATRGATEKNRTESENIAETARANARAVGQAIVDNYGFDDFGNRFLKQLRYFAGAFLHYGVSPYDHRVFTAASERNTVREQVNDPHPFTFPSPQVEFAQLPEDRASRIKSARKAFELSKQGKLYSPGNETNEDEKDNLLLGQSNPKRRRLEPPMRVRGRVGRGGRIIFDRVTYERDRGFKAASYPASVEAGGVYTGGLPIEAAPRLFKSGIKEGGLGSLALLQPVPLDDNTDDTPDDYRTLIRPLKPVSQVTSGVMQSNGTVSYWPHRRGESGGKRGRGGKTRPPSRRTIPDNEEGNSSSPNSGMQIRSTTKAIRSLPAYAPQSVPLVADVSSECSTPTPSPTPSTP